MMFTVVFQKLTERSVGEDKLRHQVASMGVEAMSLRLPGWSMVGDVPDFKSEGKIGAYTYSVVYKFAYSVSADMTDLEVSNQLTAIVGSMEHYGNRYSWMLLKAFKDEGSGQSQMLMPVSQVEADSDPTAVEVDLGTDSPYFTHIFERSAQISVALSAVEAAKVSNFTHRFHTVLYGPPGSGKTEITRAMYKMISPDGMPETSTACANGTRMNIVRMDGPSTTKAGLENFFLNTEAEGSTLLIYEEIEKAPADALIPLLGILDTRGEVRKTTGKDGQMARDVKVLCIATVNNMDKFEKMLAEALASRFTHKVYCPQATRSCMEKILSHEVRKVAGNQAWVAPTLDYVMDVEGVNDPRRAIAVCISGRDRLLTGAYQRALRAISQTQHRRAAA